MYWFFLLLLFGQIQATAAISSAKDEHSNPRLRVFLLDANLLTAIKAAPPTDPRKKELVAAVLATVDAPLNIKDVQTQGGVDKDQVEMIIKNSFDEGGLMRQLLTGFGI